MEQMIGKNLKVPRGTARRLRRADMVTFRNEREKIKRIADASTLTVNWAPKRPQAIERNPHLHDVATVTDMRDGTFRVVTYDSTPSYPANVPSPRRDRIFSYPEPMNYGKAKEISDRINRIQ